MRRYALVITLFLLVACSSESGRLSSDIASQFDASANGSIDIRGVGPRDWQRVCVLTPYNTNEIAHQVLGFKWDAEKHTSIAGSDGINVLVFIKGDEVLAYTEHPRNKGDFSHIKPRCVERENAVFSREPVTDNWAYLVVAK